MYDSRPAEIRFGALAPEGFPLAAPPGGKPFGVICEARQGKVCVRVCYRVCGPAQPLLRRYAAQMKAAGLTVTLTEVDGELVAAGQRDGECWRVGIRASGGGYRLSLSVERG